MRLLRGYSIFQCVHLMISYQPLINISSALSLLTSTELQLREPRRAFRNGTTGPLAPDPKSAFSLGLRGMGLRVIIGADREEYTSASSSDSSSTPFESRVSSEEVGGKWLAPCARRLEGRGWPTPRCSFSLPPEVPALTIPRIARRRRQALRARCICNQGNEWSTPRQEGWGDGGRSPSS